MPDLYALIPPEFRLWAWLATGAAFLILMAVQFVINRKLVNGLARSGIVSFELAGSGTRSAAILASWNADARRAAALGLRWDFGYIIAYASLFALGSAWASHATYKQWAWAPWLGWAFIGLSLIAAACDAAENLELLGQLPNAPDAGRAIRARRFAVGKFTALAVCSAFIACGIIAACPYLRATVDYAVHHVGLVIVVGLLYGMIFGLVGGGNGLPSLFWHDSPLTRISASTAATIVLLNFGTIAYCDQMIGFDQDIFPYLLVALGGPIPWGAGEQRDTFTNVHYLSRFLVSGGWPFLLLLAAPAIVPALFPSVPKIPLRSGAPGAGGLRSQAFRRLTGSLAWLAGIGLGIAISAALVWSSPWVHNAIRALTGWLIPDSFTTSVFNFEVVFIIVYIVMAGPLYKIVSPAAAICALLAVFAIVYASMSYFNFPFLARFEGWWISPGVIIMVGLIALFGWVNNDPYKLRFPMMEAYYPGGAVGLVPLREEFARLYRCPNRPPADPGGAALIDDTAALDAWRARLAPAPGDPRPKLAVVAVSGGATRSAYWVATVLDRILDKIPDFPRSVRIISGASGGMVAAAYYVRDLKDRAEAGVAPGPVKRRLPTDSIKPVARFIALRELWRSILPVRWKVDRGVELENDWPDIQVPVQDFRALEEQGRIPSLILSPMIVDDGRRLLVSNLDLWDLAGSDGSLIAEDDAGRRKHTYSLSAFELFRIFPRARDFRVSTAVRMSASFPFVSPAVNLPTDPPRRIVDAGYYDNYGVQVAGAWIQKNLDWLIENTSGVVLIQVRDAVSQMQRLEVADAPGGIFAAVARGFQFFTSPLDAVERAHYTVTAFQNDQDVQDLSELFTDRVIRKLGAAPDDQAATATARSFFTTAIFENSAIVTYGPRPEGSWPGDGTEKVVTSTSDVGLDWYVSQAEREGLEASIPPDPTGPPWNDPARRAARIQELLAAVAATHGPERDLKLKQLEQARNYERLIHLQSWWQTPGPVFPPPPPPAHQP
jgi:hypothetical protein